MELSEKKTLRQLEKLEAKKTKLFEEAKQEPSQSLIRAKARQIRDIEQRIQGLQAVLGPLGARISVLDRLIPQYEMGQFAEGSSALTDALRQTDAQVIQQQMDEALAQDVLQDEKMQNMLDTFRIASDRDEEVYEDEDIAGIMEDIERAAALEAGAEEVAVLREEETIAPDSEPPMAE